MYCPKGITPRNRRGDKKRLHVILTYRVSLWLSKSCCYERPYYVTGVGIAEGQKSAPKLRDMDMNKGTGEAVNMESAYSVKCFEGNEECSITSTNDCESRGMT